MNNSPAVIYSSASWWKRHDMEKLSVSLIVLDVNPPVPIKGL